jgi:Na+/proline symporter
LFFRRASRAGAILSMTSGLLFYLLAEYNLIDFHIPPLFVGFGFSMLGMMVGQYLSKKDFLLHI